MTNSSLQDQTTYEWDVVDIKPGVKFSVGTLKEYLPDVESVLFFGKLYGLDASQLASLLNTVLATTLTKALFAEGGTHSNDLQDYLLDGYTDEDGNWHDPIISAAQAGDVSLAPVIPKGEILPEVWKSLEIEVAQSIKDVAAKLEKVIDHLPGKKGSMVFGALRKFNAKRPQIGDYRAQIKHEAQQKNNLVVLDVSGSMSESTISQIIDDVVALSYVANAWLAIVSNNSYYWEPGTYDTDDVLRSAEYGGTHYETLKDLMARDWGTVVTIADYDSSLAAKNRIAKCKGSIDELLDISLVNHPTFLAECLGQLATKQRPLLIGSSAYMVY